jgi:hypothetical protein
MTQATAPKPVAKAKGSRANRRSKRLPAAHRMLLTILNPTGSEIAKEIVSTVEISQHGARVRGRRIFRSDAEGLLTQLSTGRQARVRVAWQHPASGAVGFLDSGVELLTGFDYWGVSFIDPSPLPEPEPQTESAETAHGAAATAPPQSSAGAAQELIEALVSEGAERPQVLEAVWCALVEQLEARQSLTRADLVAAIRSLAKPARPSEKAAPPSREKK